MTLTVEIFTPQIKLVTYPIAWSDMSSVYPDSSTWLKGTNCEGKEIRTERAVSTVYQTLICIYILPLPSVLLLKGLFLASGNAIPTSRDLSTCIR